MNKILIIANWKCNPVAVVEAKNLFKSASSAVKNVRGAEVIICSPFVHLSDIKNGPKDQGPSVALGAQNCFWEQGGAYTGEVSPMMLKNLGCKYVIIGHSERRKYFNETNESINKKIKAVFEVGLKPIFCVGEKHDEKEIIKEVLEKQLFEGLIGVPVLKIPDLIIAYEPVWAISSEEGEYCAPEYAFSANLIIKKFLLKEYDKTVVDKVRIIYGGSVDSKDADLYIKEGKLAGVLVGKASLNAPEFSKIIMSVAGL